MAAGDTHHPPVSLLCTDPSGRNCYHLILQRRQRLGKSASLGSQGFEPQNPVLLYGRPPSPQLGPPTSSTQAPQALTCRLSLLQTPLTVLVGAMVTTGGVLGTLWPPGGTMMGPMGTRLGVLAGELWLVAGEDTGDDSLLSEEPAREGHRASAGATDSDLARRVAHAPSPHCRHQLI